MDRSTLRRRAVAFAACAGLAACTGDIGQGSFQPVCGGPGKACVSGTIFGDSAGVNGTALGGATVSVDGTIFAQANQQGWFAASGVPAGSAVPLCVEDPSHVTRCRTVALSEGESLLLSDTRLMEKSAPASQSGADYVGAAGGQITLAADAACVAGVPASGVTCRLSPIDVAIPAQRQLASGNFTGQTSGGAAVALETGAMMDIDCRDAAGARVNVCPGKTAAVRIPILSGCADDVRLPSTMTTWSFDESSGLWRQEAGSLAKTCAGDAGYYAGAVSHFSSWTAGQVIDAVTSIKGFVRSGTQPVEGALVHCDGTDY